MPNRILRDYTDSLAFDGMSADAERLWTRLLVKADDFGRYHADPRLVKAGCFPLLDTLRTNELARWLDELSHRSLIFRYEAKGRSYLAIPRFRQRLRQETSKYPPPDGEPADWRPTDDRQVTDSGRLETEEETKRREVEEETKRKEKAKAKAAQARASSLQEVESFFHSEKLPSSDAKYFWLKCEENGWKNGGHPILNWRMTVQKWKAGGFLPSQKNGSLGSRDARKPEGNPGFSNSDQHYEGYPIYKFDKDGKML